MDTAGKMYLRKFSLAMAAYVVVLILVVLAAARLDASPWRYLVWLLPAIPVVFMVGAYLGFLAKMDELAQRIQLIALGFAFGVTALLTFTYGMLENAGLPSLSLVWVFPLMIVLWGIGTAAASRRYR